MNRGRTNLIAAVAVAAIACALCLAWRIFILQKRVESFRQKQIANAEQIRVLIQECDESARKFSILQRDNDRLLRNTSELQKLRGEIASLRKNTPAPIPPEIRAEPLAELAGPGEAPEESDLNEQQKSALKDFSEKVKTGNSINDLDRLKDSFARWDELFIDPAPEEMKPVFRILKERVAARIVELREEKIAQEAASESQPE